MTDNGYGGKPDWICRALDQYEGSLSRYARRITRDEDRARDAVQETFLRLCREDPQTLDGHLAEWLFTVCRNKAIDMRRKDGRMTTLAQVQLPEAECESPAPDDLAERHDSVNRILGLLETLPDNQQEVVRLKFQSELSYREISGVTGLSVTNVGFLIHRALKTLRLRLKHHSHPTRTKPSFGEAAAGGG